MNTYLQEDLVLIY